MSAGRRWIQEIYVGFLLLLLSFLYLSHLTSEYRGAEAQDEINRLHQRGLASAQIGRTVARIVPISKI